MSFSIQVETTAIVPRWLFNILFISLRANNDTLKQNTLRGCGKTDGGCIIKVRHVADKHYNHTEEYGLNCQVSIG